jgi:hypothetical protein
MEIRHILCRFFLCFEKAVVFETGTEGQAGPDKKRPGDLFFYVGSNQYRLVLNKSVPD